MHLCALATSAVSAMYSPCDGPLPTAIPTEAGVGLWAFSCCTTEAVRPLTVLSSTRRLSLPGATTTFNLPLATRESPHLTLASSNEPCHYLTHPLDTSFSTILCVSLGLPVACFQLCMHKEKASGTSPPMDVVSLVPKGACDPASSWCLETGCHTPEGLIG